MSYNPDPQFEQGILARLKQPYSAVMLYGSTARGTSRAGSDVDVLQVARDRFPSYREGILNVSVYTLQTLKEMAMGSSLFVLHLKLEGRIIYDPENLLKFCVESYRDTDDYTPLLADLRFLAGFLDCPRSAYVEHANAFNQMAVFILRSTLFAILAQQHRPTFEMQKVSDYLRDPRVLRAYSLKQTVAADVDLFEFTKSVVGAYLGCGVFNPYGSYEKLLLDTTKKSEFVRAVALHFLKRMSGEEAYGLFKYQING